MTHRVIRVKTGPTRRVKIPITHRIYDDAPQQRSALSSDRTRGGPRAATCSYGVGRALGLSWISTSFANGELGFAGAFVGAPGSTAPSPPATGAVATS